MPKYFQLYSPKLVTAIDEPVAAGDQCRVYQLPAL